MRWLKSILRTHVLRRRFPLCVIHEGVRISPDSTIGDHVVLFPRVALVDARIGRFSYVQADSVIYNASVGPFCSIAAGVSIGLGAHPTHMVTTSPVFYDNTQPLPRFLTDRRVYADVLLPTTIDADVWVGHGALIKAGVRIGVGAVIGAGSVVTKDVPPYAVAAGNPCRVIRSRFSEDLCSGLLESRWWELDEERLRHLGPLFEEPEKLLAALRPAAGR